MSKPNVLIMLADQWRAASTGWAGDPDVRTPHLDRLAAQGLDVRLAMSGCPVCTPARASLLTGLRPDRHGLFLNDAPLNPELDSFPKRFAAAGYDTAYVGKWHVDGHGRHGFVPRERRHGFAYWKALECTHDYTNSPYQDHDEPTLKRWAGYDAFAQADDLCAWMEQHDRAQPFLAVLAWGPPHNPYRTAPPEYLARFHAETIQVRDNVPTAVAAKARADLAGYAAHIAALDDGAGRVLATLDRLGLAEDTIVVFTSDHGDFLGAHGLWDKQGPWDEALRVPFLMRWPGHIAAGAQLDLVLDLIDLGPTLCGLAGVPAVAGAQGRDLSPHLCALDLPQDNLGLYACYHNFGNWPRYAVEPLYTARCARGVRTARWTYVEDRQGPWLLYDNHADPLQCDNLIGRGLPEQADLAQTLHRKLAAERDDFRDGLDYVRDWGYAVDASGSLSTRA